MLKITMQSYFQHSTLIFKIILTTEIANNVQKKRKLLNH